MNEQEDHVFYILNKKLKNKIVPIKGENLAALAGKPSRNPKRCIWLMNVMEKNKADYSLWYVELENEDGDMSFWPYNGDEDKIKLIQELLEKFLEHAFDED